ncbi:MAG: hypothetical protein GY853_16090 [PVC group bacterium]|nr:hypothetical protein [PVC group bacterium]
MNNKNDKKDSEKQLLYNAPESVITSANEFSDVNKIDTGFNSNNKLINIISKIKQSQVEGENTNGMNKTNGNGVRRDAFGNEIVKSTKNKNHKVSFIDMLNKNQLLTTVVEVENYKDYNNEFFTLGEHVGGRFKEIKGYKRKQKQKEDCDCCKPQ